MGTIGMGFLFFLFNVLANILFTVVSIFLAPVFPMARLLSIANCASGVPSLVPARSMIAPHCTQMAACKVRRCHGLGRLLGYLRSVYRTLVS
jgi:hypothetical protein